MPKRECAGSPARAIVMSILDHDSPLSPAIPPTERRLVRYSADYAEAWDELVARSVNGTFMHTRRFLGYHPQERFCDQSLMMLDEAGRIVGVFPAAETRAGGLRTLQSHPGASYGGWVVDGGASFAAVDRMVAELVAYAEEQGFEAIRMRVAEKIFLRRRSDELDVAYFRAGFELEGRELSSAFDLSASGGEDVSERFLDNGRRNTRKAQRLGVVARVTDDFPAYWRILETNLRDSHGVSPTHTLPEILRLRELFPERIHLMGGYLGDRLVSGAVLFLMNDVCGHVMYMAQDYEFQANRSLNLVLKESLDECRSRGLRHLNYGISSIPGSGGRLLNEGLHSFKRSCGGEGVTRDVLVKKLA